MLIVNNYFLKQSTNLLNRIKNLLLEPFPEESTITDTIKLAAVIGFFIFLFLYLIRPFNLDSAGSDVLLYSFYFGFVTFIVTVLYDVVLIFILKIKSNHPSWTFAKWIISTVGLVICIGIVNYIVMAFINEVNHFSWKVLLSTIYYTFLLGTFPIVFLGTIMLVKRSNTYQEVAKTITPKIQAEKNEEIIVIENNGDTINIPAKNFIYAESSKNYVLVCYWEHSLQKVLIRSTLTALSDQILERDIIRCHRSFLVNKQNVDAVTGNAQGLKLKMKNSDTIIPVSRKYIALFK